MEGVACNDNPCQNGGSCIPQRFRHECICPDGFGGLNCQFPGCGGTITSYETPQQISIPDFTDPMIGCLWTIDSPADSRINILIEESSCYNCFEIQFTVWSG